MYKDYKMLSDGGNFEVGKIVDDIASKFNTLIAFEVASEALEELAQSGLTSEAYDEEVRIAVYDELSKRIKSGNSK